MRLNATGHVRTSKCWLSAALISMVVLWLTVATLAISVNMAAATLAPSSDSVDLKILVICPDGSEPSCSAATDVIQRLGAPYTLVYADRQEITAGMLSDGAGHAYYSGVILSNSNLVFLNPATGNWESALGDGEWNILHEFEARFSLREASVYAFPTPDLGLTYVRSVDTTAAPLSTSLTAAGTEVFDYLKTDSTITFKNSWGYLARPAYLAVPADGDTTPLIKTSDGLTVAAIHHYSDGRMSLAVCVDSNPNLVHSQALMYGIIRWVSRGLFIGERHVYMAPQVDDLFLGNEMWDTATNTTLPTEYRMSGSDLEFVTWQQQNIRSTHPQAAAFRLNLAFNGEGTTAYGTSDTLVSAARNLQSNFYWTNHTYSHENLDTTNYAQSLAEIEGNHPVATGLGLTLYNRAGLVTGDISGLGNLAFLTAARDAGVLYVASNTSIPGQDNPSPNTGVDNALMPGILEIPRHPTNIYYNVVSPEQEVSEYNFLYHSYWGRNLTYPEIINVESDNLLNYMLTYDIDPLMFHQANLIAYNSATYGQGTLLADLVDATLNKYESFFTLPVKTPSFEDIGQKMISRDKFNKAGVAGSAGGGQVNVTAGSTCTVPVTGLAGMNTEIYGGEPISYLDLSGGATFSVAASEAPVFENRQPQPGSTLNSGRPHIGVEYTDPAWGVDISSVRISVDGSDVTGAAVAKGSFVSYVPGSISDGTHTVQITAASLGGQTTTDSWQFSITTPKPTVSVSRAYWASFADYEARLLSVDYLLKNIGSGRGMNASVEGGIANNGVIMITAPFAMGDLAAGQSTTFTLQYHVPNDVFRFGTLIYLTCTDDEGNYYGMRAPS